MIAHEICLHKSCIEISEVVGNEFVVGMPPHSYQHTLDVVMLQGVGDDGTLPIDPTLEPTRTQRAYPMRAYAPSL